MAVLIVLAFVLALCHLVYEGILLPSMRLRLRFMTFELRDRLRVLAHDRGDSLDSKVYHHVHNSLNGTLRLLYQIDIRMAWDIRRILREDPKLVKRIMKRAKEVEACDIPEIRDIQKEHGKIITCALLANSAGFFIMALPAFLVLAATICALRRMNHCRERMRRYSEELACLPEQQLERKLNLSEPLLVS